MHPNATRTEDVSGAREETAKGDGTMTTSSTRQQKPTEIATDDTANKEDRTSAASDTMTCDETTPTEMTTRHDTTQGMSRTKQAPPKMTSDQRQNPTKRNRPNASKPPQGAASRNGISKRNRRRKKQFTDPDQLESEIRQAYFSAASWVAIRYSVSVEDLIEHLRAGGLHHAARPMTASQYVEDIVLCVAICNGCKQAWNDLRQVFDLTLSRACTLTMSEQDSMVFVQKFLSELAEDTERACAHERAAREQRETGSNGAPHEAHACEDAGLRGYIGLSPLRVWLTNKILATLEEMPLPESIPATDNGRAARPSLQLVD